MAIALLATAALPGSSGAVPLRVRPRLGAPRPSVRARVLQRIRDWQQFDSNTRAAWRRNRRAIDRYLGKDHGENLETLGYAIEPIPPGKRATGLDQVSFHVDGGPRVWVKNHPEEGWVGVSTWTDKSFGADLPAWEKKWVFEGVYPWTREGHRGPLQGLSHARELASRWVGSPHWRQVTGVSGPATLGGVERITFLTGPSLPRQLARGAAVAGAAAGAGALGARMLAGGEAKAPPGVQGVPTYQGLEGR